MNTEILFSESDWGSFSEDGYSCEELEENDSNYGGQAQSILSSMEDSIRKIDDFLFSERGFMTGDIVCSITNPSGQMGKVVNVNMLVDLENVHGYTIKDVNSKKLLKIRLISAGDYVIHGPWLGTVDKVVDRVTILFDDGTKYEVMATDRDMFIPISPSIIEDSQFPYYPGQRVQVKVSPVSKPARWFCSTWKGTRNEGTIHAVEAGLVYVSWFASLAVSDPNSPPSSLQDSKNLTLLSCFPHEFWRVGDWCMYPFLNGKEDTRYGLLKVSEPYGGCRKLCTRTDGRDRIMDCNEMFAISRTETKVDVLWQDGTCSLGLDSKSLIPVNTVNAHEFWPNQFVLEMACSESPHLSKDQRWGVVRGMDSTERTVSVMWRTSATNEDTDVKGDLSVEILSTYELLEHPDYSYCLSDIVFRVETKTCVGHAKNCCGDQNMCPSICYLSSFGYVTGLDDGSVKVRWANGTTSKVAPYEILRVQKPWSTNLVQYEEHFEEFDHNRVGLDKKSFHWNGKDWLGVYGVDVECKGYPWGLSLSQRAIGVFTNIAAYLLATLGSPSLSSSMSSVDTSESGNEFNIAGDEDIQESQTNCTKQPLVVDGLQIEVTHEDSDVFKFPSDSAKPGVFRQFDAVSDCSDHHFADVSYSGLHQVNGGWLKKVQQEWSILQKDLPESIYVRFYVERMDLLRVAIVGAHGTPYQDGLFFFDIFLPTGYPHEAPLVHYNSGGLRLNPNLYESGKVCLSLLNTWTGSGNEIWNPRNSTILQVLLSLQALVLNEKPYFNEAGYDRQVGSAVGEKNSVSYNENAFLVTCNSMLYTLRKPPMQFEALVEEHFRRRSPFILAACKAYIKGNENESSTGFKIMLGKLLPTLIQAFADKGIDCSRFVESE